MKKTATIKDVAALAGASLGSVSNFINGTKVVSPGTSARIEAAIAELQFVPNNAVRTLQGGSNRAIGLVVPDAANPHFTELAGYVEDVARSRGYVIVYCDTSGEAERERAYLRQLAEMRVQGVIITALHHDKVELNDLLAVNTRVVLLGERQEGSPFASVSPDHFRGGYLALSHLLSLGRRNVLFAGGPGGGDVLDARVSGARQAIQDHPDAAQVRFRRVDAHGRMVGERAALVDAVLAAQERPDAVYCGNDMIALTLMNALLRRGVRIPEDVAIVGNDDIDAAQHAVIPLTTVRTPVAEMGRTAAELILDGSGRDSTEEPHIGLDVELVVRESTVRSPSFPHIVL